MKKYLSVFTALVAAVSLLLCGCGNVAAPGAGADDGKLSIVTTIFPEYDWVMNILGSNPAKAEVSMLLDNGVDLHSYQPTAEDLMKISSCDVFIYVGGESDEWVEDALEEAVNKNMVVVNLMDSLGSAVKQEEIVEGMEHNHDHDHDDHDDHDGDDHDDHDDLHDDDHDGDDHDDHDADDHDEHDRSGGKRNGKTVFELASGFHSGSGFAAGRAGPGG